MNTDFRRDAFPQELDLVLTLNICCEGTLMKSLNIDCTFCQQNVVDTDCASLSRWEQNGWSSEQEGTLEQLLTQEMEIHRNGDMAQKQRNCLLCTRTNI